MSKREEKQLMVLNQVGIGQLSGRQAAEVLDMSLRQMQRMTLVFPSAF